MQLTQLAEGLAWPEGPSVLADGRVIFVETYRSHVAVYEPGKGVSRFANTGGGPNATAVGSDGLVYVTQNGGVVGPWRAEEMRPPSIQRIDASGRVEILVTEVDGVRLQAPNDLSFAPDGSLYFTDPGNYDPATRPNPGYVFRVGPDGSGELVAELPPVYPNGIIAEADGSVVWDESYTRAVKRRTPDGAVREICVLADPRAVPDGLKQAADGTLYVTGGPTGQVYLLTKEGRETGSHRIGRNPTNLTFHDDVVFVTDGGHTGESPTPEFKGVLWAVELGVRGAPLYPGRLR
jgi:gluconolactonase